MKKISNQEQKKITWTNTINRSRKKPIVVLIKKECEDLDTEEAVDYWRFATEKKNWKTQLEISGNYYWSISGLSNTKKQWLSLLLVSMEI